MTLVEDISTARQTVLSLERLAESLLAHYGDTLDGRRLRADVGRLRADLDLLCGPTPSPQAPHEPIPAAPRAPEQPQHVVPDVSYTDAFWMDAEDEGLGRYEGRGR